MERPMTPETLETRMDRLEHRVTLLEQLPARLDALGVQISQLREEMREEFSALRKELREEIRKGDQDILTQARIMREDVIARLALIQEGRPPRRKRR
jgi:F0F1-type ATP synthase membrane subunit b/b'